MTKQTFKNKYSYLQKKLSNSVTLKVKHGWSRESGAGFIKSDIKDVNINTDGSLHIIFNWPHEQSFEVSDLNFRETEELLAFVKESQ